MDGSATTGGEVVGQTFTADKLRPFTNYTFRVAGVNSEGRGRFSNKITLRTHQDGNNLKLIADSYLKYFAVPGVVSNFVVELKFTSLVLNWSPPKEPNGVIIAYEVSYRHNNQFRVTRNTTNVGTNLTTEGFLPNIIIASISVRAYTMIGPGPTTMRPNVVIPQKPLPRE